ncbi:zinc finger and BTB domain-containing protein 41 isoform X2 [Nothobranchius furzeri]|uniref:Transcript variant X2 n=1 Tax=Nothobranchius furzeri TaxID=105023 RepID=A0A9D2YJK3_NOTFU|nr:zinc finger protein 568 isoform X2 [Nothobranchius furzeri]KAF7221691.1 transcript variant X2 [Nothobranchius furzeri]
MSEIEALRAFVLEQLSTAATEIIGAFTKTITSYEERISCLEKENERCRSVATAKLPKTADDPDAEAGKGADAVGPHAIDSGVDFKTKETGLISSAEMGSFVTRDHFLKSVSTENCPFCCLKVAATDRHLTQKHFVAAVHFVEDGTVKFVVPCMCKDVSQRRSHWHCPICVKILNRRCSFEVHLTKQHECSVLHRDHGTAEDAEAGKGADDVGPHAVESETESKTRETLLISSTETGSFVTRDHFLKSVSTKNCPFCFRKVAATERHLTQKHYAAAVRFIEDGTVKFVVPCMCRDAPQHRSHWHCPICVKTISRRTSFEVHITRQHVCSVLQPSYGAEKLLRRHQQKEQQSLIANLAQELDICVVDSYIQDLGQIGAKSNSQQHASTQVMKTLDDGFAELLDPANESQHTTKNENVCQSVESETTRDSSEAVGPLRIKSVKRPSFPGNPSGKRATHRCKACGKIFHYTYTLKTHVQTHTRDRFSVCGLCGKRLGNKEHLVQHLKNHNKKNKCETCGKQFSSDSHLKRHKKFHQPKTMNTFS